MLLKGSRLSLAQRDESISDITEFELSATVSYLKNQVEYHGQFASSIRRLQAFGGGIGDHLLRTANSYVTSDKKAKNTLILHSMVMIGSIGKTEAMKKMVDGSLLADLDQNESFDIKQNEIWCPDKITRLRASGEDWNSTLDDFRLEPSYKSQYEEELKNDHVRKKTNELSRKRIQRRYKTVKETVRMLVYDEETWRAIDLIISSPSSTAIGQQNPTILNDQPPAILGQQTLAIVDQAMSSNKRSFLNVIDPDEGESSSKRLKFDEMFSEVFDFFHTLTFV